MKERDKARLLVVACFLLSFFCVSGAAKAREAHIFSKSLTLQQQANSNSDESTDTQTARKKKK